MEQQCLRYKRRWNSQLSVQSLSTMLRCKNRVHHSSLPLQLKINKLNLPIMVYSNPYNMKASHLLSQLCKLDLIKAQRIS